MKTEQLELKLTRHPSSPLFTQLANEYLSQGRIDEAIQTCQAGLLHHPSYSTAQLILSRCFEMQTNYSAASEHIKSAIELNPDSVFLKTIHNRLEQYISGAIQVTQEPPNEVSTLEEISVESDGSNTVTLQDSQSDNEEISDTIVVEEVTEAIVSSEVAQTEIIDIVQESKSEQIPSEPIVALPQDELQITSPPIRPYEERSTDELLKDVQVETPEITDDLITEEISIPEDVTLTSKVEDSIESVSLSDDSESDGNIVESESPTLVSNDIYFSEELTPKEKISQDDVIQATEETIIEEPDEETTITEYLPLESSEVVTSPPIEETPVHEIYPQTILESESGDSGNIATKTLAEIYASQGAFSEALHTYRVLLKQKPGLKAEIESRIQELEGKLQNKLSE